MKRGEKEGNSLTLAPASKISFLQYLPVALP